MNKLKFQIVELVDAGHSLETSSQLQELISQAEGLQAFYDNLQLSQTQLQNYLSQEAVASSKNSLHSFIDQELGMHQQPSSFNVNRYVSVALAAGVMLFAFNFFTPLTQDSTVLPAQEPIVFVEAEIIEPEVVEKPNAIYVVELEKDQSLWSKSTELAKELNVDRYQVMYALYEANKEAFADSDINQIQYGQELQLVEEMIFALSPQDANDEVNRHIYCRC